MNKENSTPAAERVLAVLSRARDTLSGEQISRELGISRAAVNQAIQRLRKEGYEIFSSTNRGYRLVDIPDLLTRGAMITSLEAERLARVVCLPVTESTNTALRDMAEHGAPDGQVVIADAQTAGRGRVGRTFASPQGKGIYLSYLIRPDKTAGETGVLSDWLTVTGRTAVAVSDAIDQVCLERPAIKWVNDLFMGGRKICGILTQTEMEAESGEISALIIGIGVNVLEAPEDFPEELRDIATSIRAATGRTVKRAALAAEIIRNLDLMRQGMSGPPGRYLTAYREHCNSVGRNLLLNEANGGREARALDITDRFGLRVRFPDGTEQELVGGEILRYL